MAYMLRRKEDKKYFCGRFSGVPQFAANCGMVYFTESEQKGAENMFELISRHELSPKDYEVVCFKVVNHQTFNLTLSLGVEDATLHNKKVSSLP